MTCDWCHEFTPPNRKDGYCSDICKEHMERAKRQAEERRIAGQLTTTPPKEG